MLAVDVFDPDKDLTMNNLGFTMAQYYQTAMEEYSGISQEEIFDNETRACGNVIKIKNDSMCIDELPVRSVCFAFIDGNHDPEYIRNDFYLAWNKLSSRGCIAFHDYEGDIPESTKTIKELEEKHNSEIICRHQIKSSWLLFLIRE